MAHYLDRTGYDTAIAGKMHFVGPDQHHGFRRRLIHYIYPAGSDWTKSRDHKRPRTHAGNYVPAGLRVVNQPLRAGGKAPRVLELDEEAHRAGLDYLQARGNDGAPFFLTVSYNHPHEPFHPLKEFWDLYEGQEIHLERDPGEWNNLAGNPDYRNVEQDLRSLILDRFEPEAIELDLRASLARREFIRDAAGDRKPNWNLTPDPVS